MAALQIDGAFVAHIEPEDARLLVELAKRGEGAMVGRPRMGFGRVAAPTGTRQVQGVEVMVLRTEWLATLSLQFNEDQPEGEDLAELHQAEAANDAGDLGEDPELAA